MTTQTPEVTHGADETEVLARRIAEVALAAELEELAAGIAHRLNQPLGAIAAFAQAGSRVLDDPAARPDQASAIFHEIARLALEAGAELGRIRARCTITPSRTVCCRVESAVAAIEPILRSIAASHDGSLAVLVGEGLPVLRIDPTQLQYVLINLVRRLFGAAASSHGSAHVTIEISAGHAELLIGIFVSGRHTWPAHDAFDAPVATSLTGGGLSLAASRSIVEAHGGSIGFESLRQGGRVRIRLPGLPSGAH